MTRFEIQLADLTRRFKNLEALRAEVAAKGGGFEARRIFLQKLIVLLVIKGGLKNGFITDI